MPMCTESVGCKCDLPQTSSAVTQSHPPQACVLYAACSSVATPSEQDDGPGARNMTMDKVLEELSVTFYFVSEFMRRVGGGLSLDIHLV